MGITAGLIKDESANIELFAAPLLDRIVPVGDGATIPQRIIQQV
jgi:hypothetical protein